MKENFTDADRLLGIRWGNSRPQSTRPMCFTVGCENKSVLTHTLQQKGIISELCGFDNHLFELRTNYFGENYYYLKKIGWEHAMTMYGFCAQCDQQNFGPIENPVRLPETLADACRYSLRPIVHEIRKKEGNIKFLEQRDRDLFLEFPEISPYNGNLRGIALLRSIAECVEAGIYSNAPLQYTIRLLPRLELCASAILLRPVAVHGNNRFEFVMKLNEMSKIKNSSFNVVNVFPFQNHTVFLSLTHDDTMLGSIEFQKKIVSASQVELQLLLSDMVIGQIEDWCISEKLFAKAQPSFIEIVNNAKKRSNNLFGSKFGIDLFSL